MLTAPLDVFFEGANPVQPDLVVMLPGWNGMLAQRGPQGAPDLLIEILSPSNRGHDLLTKRALYARAGVREYWIVDPTSQTVEVLTLDRDAFHTIQTAAGDDVVVSSLLGGAAFRCRRSSPGSTCSKPEGTCRYRLRAFQISSHGHFRAHSGVTIG